MAANVFNIITICKIFIYAAGAAVLAAWAVLFADAYRGSSPEERGPSHAHIAGIIRGSSSKPPARKPEELPARAPAGDMTVLSRAAFPNQENGKLPQLFVLSIGVADYPGSLRLDCAARDARVVGITFLESSRRAYRQVTVHLLENRQATREKILRQLDWLREQMQAGDVGVFFFAGHGGKGADGRYYLLPIDANLVDLPGTAIAGFEVKSALAAARGQVLTILDTCHAAAFDAGRNRGMTVMASSQKQEFARESQTHGHGYFTHALVEGLAGKADANRDGTVDSRELETYVAARVRESSKGRQNPVTSRAVFKPPLLLACR